MNAVISLFLYSILLIFSIAHAAPERCTGANCRFNPLLLGGVRGYPGVRARLNARMFRYASQLVGELLSREIQHARLPDIVQTTQPLLDGEILLHNGYVARYRCPQRVVVMTKSPDRLLLQLQNYDVGINTNVAGHVKLMVPMVAEEIVPSGVLKIDVHGMILTVEIAVESGPKGPKVSVASCSNYINKIDISMERRKGDEYAHSTLSFLKRFVSKFVRDLLPNEICKMVPRIVDQQINERFLSLPQAIALTQLETLTGMGIFSTAPPIPEPSFCAQQCGLTVSPTTNVSVLPPRKALGKPFKIFSSTMHPLCSQCSSATADHSTSIMKNFAKHLNLRKLTDLFLSVKMLDSHATPDGFAVDLTGEFSPEAQGGTPFGPFPTFFPAPLNDHMVEVIVSDYTLNSLFYWAHRKGLISFRVGPEHPQMGAMLKTTCADPDDDEDFTLDPAKRRRRAASLADLGICVGDIFPALAEKYPSQNLSLQIHATQAPSVLLSARRGGSATVDVQAEADIFIDGTTTKVGTLTALVKVDIALHLRGKRIFGKGEISTLKLTDKTGKLGSDQEALDNVGALGKDFIAKSANEALRKGIPITMTQSPAQPATFYNLQIKIIEHGLYVAADITISPALLGTLDYAGSCYRF